MKNASAEKCIPGIVNFFEVSGIFIVIILAFLMQFIYNELPCPLCLLQRFGFIAIAFGFLLNFRFGYRPSHYSIVLISSIFTAFVAMRQIALHILPGTGSYGGALFGIHLYTWSFIVTVIIITVTTILLGVDKQYLVKPHKTLLWKYVTQSLFGLLVFLTIANLASTVLICGFAECPESPTDYRLLTPTNS